MFLNFTLVVHTIINKAKFADACLENRIQASAILFTLPAPSFRKYEAK